MIVVRELCTDRRFTFTPFIGCQLATVWFWLTHNGWGVTRCGCGWVACEHTRLRFVLRRRTWIEDPARPATLPTVQLREVA